MFKKKRFYLFILQIYFFSCNLLFAQDLSFINYNTKDGLSSSQVYNIFQNKNGDMLFATDRGITKFDGYRFEIFSKENGITNSTVFKFIPQQDGTIWCSTIDNSWFYFKNGTTTFIACPYNDIIQEGSKGGQAEDIWVDDKNNIHVGFENLSDYIKINSKNKSLEHTVGKINIFKDSLEAVFVFTQSKVFKHYQQVGNTQNDWKGFSTIKIGQSRDKMGYKKSEFINESCIFSTNNHLIILNKDGKSKELNLGSKIIGIGKYDNSHFWVGMAGDGIKILDMNGTQKYHWLKEKSPTSMLKDKDGGIWISTLDNGVYYAHNEYINLIPTKNNFIYSISPGKDMEPLISTLFEHYQLHNFQLQSPIFINSNINKVFYHKEDQRYYDKVRKVKLIDPNYNFSSFSIIDFSENEDHPLIASSPFNFVVYKNGAFYLTKFDSRITAIENAENGALIGGYNGLSSYSFLDRSTKKYDYPQLTSRITDIKLKGKYHFVGTNENGVVRIFQKENKFLTINKKNGLASNLVNEVFPESETVLWVATNNGLDRVTFNGDKYVIKHFGKEHGLIDNDITDVYVHNNIIWIGTRSGLLSITKSNFERISKSTRINLFWTKTYINGKSSDFLNNYTFSYDQNNLELEFHSAFYGGTSRVKYRYKIANSKDTWHQIKSRNVTLNNLIPGKYKIILQANVDNTNWTDNQIMMYFTISPPYYQTWWFRTIIISLVFFLIYLFFRFRVLIYNRSLVKEALRLIIRKLNPQLKSFVINEQGKELRINSMDILYFKSQGNYLDIHLNDKKHTIRHKIGEIDELVPDKIEYIRVNKSYVVRIDKITGKNVDSIFIDKIEIPIGTTFKKSVKELKI